MKSPTLDQRVPCAKCPWRKDADPSYWHPEELLRMSRNLRNGGVMLCHKSPSNRSEPLPKEDRSPLSGTLPERALCAGYVLVDRFRSLGLRLWALRNGMDPTKACSSEGVELHESWDAVLLTLPRKTS